MNINLEEAYQDCLVDNLKEPKLIILDKKEFKSLKKNLKKLTGVKKPFKGELRLFGARLVYSKELKEKK